MYKNSTFLDLNSLTQDTQYRFTEIELSKVVRILERITHNQLTARTILIDALAPNVPQRIKNILNETMYDQYFMKPKHADMIQYFRYKNLSIQKIRKFVNVSPNSLTKGATYDYMPDLKPIFPHWNEYSYIQVTWDNMKHFFNLFNEDLVQMITPPRAIIPLVPSQPQPKQQPQQQQQSELSKILKEMDEIANPFKQQWQPAPAPPPEELPYHDNSYWENSPTLKWASPEERRAHVELLKEMNIKQDWRHC